MRVLGIPGLKKHWQQHKKEKHAALERGLLKAGLLIQAESQRQTPVDTGALRNSHRTQKQSRGRDQKGRSTKGGGAGMMVTVSVQAAYALWVHERMDLHHPVGNAKFLENASRQSRGAVLALIKEEMQ